MAGNDPEPFKSGFREIRGWPAGSFQFFSGETRLSTGRGFRAERDGSPSFRRPRRDGSIATRHYLFLANRGPARCRVMWRFGKVGGRARSRSGSATACRRFGNSADRQWSPVRGIVAYYGRIPVPRDGARKDFRKIHRSRVHDRCRSFILPTGFLVSPIGPDGVRWRTGLPGWPPSPVTRIRRCL